jgi:hypothetical protein
MSRNSLLASVGLLAGLVAALAAQTPSSNSEVDQKTIPSGRVTVAGCVGGGPAAGPYRLTDAFLSGGDIPSTAKPVRRAGSGNDVSFETRPSCDLIGGHLQAPEGHMVEVVGITSATKLNNRDAFRSAIARRRL